MESYVILLSALGLLLIALATLLWTLRTNQRQMVTLIESQRQQLSQLSQNETERAELQSRVLAQLMDKALALVATTDPLAYQAIQAMGPASGYDDGETFDPSDEGEIHRLVDLGRESRDDDDGLNAQERDILEDLNGIAPEFFLANPPAPRADAS